MNLVIEISSFTIIMTSCTIRAAQNFSLGDDVTTFFEALKIQRFDDHRYYHHSRINQSLHFISAISFVVAYAFLLIDPVISALIA